MKLCEPSVVRVDTFFPNYLIFFSEAPFENSGGHDPQMGFTAVTYIRLYVLSTYILLILTLCVRMCQRRTVIKRACLEHSVFSSSRLSVILRNITQWRNELLESYTAVRLEVLPG